MKNEASVVPLRWMLRREYERVIPCGIKGQRCTGENICRLYGSDVPKVPFSTSYRKLQDEVIASPCSAVLELMRTLSPSRPHLCQSVLKRRQLIPRVIQPTLQAFARVFRTAYPSGNLDK